MRQFSYTNYSISRPIWGKMLLSQTLRFSKWQPLAVKPHPIKGSNTLNLEGSSNLDLKTFSLAITASGLTRNRQLPSICIIRSLFNQLMYTLIWIFFFSNKYSPPTLEKPKQPNLIWKTTLGTTELREQGSVLTNEKYKGKYELNIVTRLSFKKSSN